jgi:hypothetical protein
MTHSLIWASTRTHAKIVACALAASILVVLTATAARFSGAGHTEVRVVAKPQVMVHARQAESQAQ